MEKGKAAILRRFRTEHARQVRRMYGDTSGMCRFGDCYFRPDWGGVSNTITTVLKDNLLLVIEKRKRR